MSESIQSSWEESYISEHFKLLIGGTPSRSNNAYWDNAKLTGNKWVSIKDIKSRYILDTEEQITDLGVEKSNVKLVPENTVIMSFKLTIGRLTITKCPLYTNEAIISFIPKKFNSVDTNYLYYGLQSWSLLGEADQAVKGATLNKDKMSKILGLFPPLPEQQKIASILTSVDEVIENTQIQIDKLQDLKKATMNELLTKGIGHKEFKDSELGRIPKSWKVERMSSIAKITDSLHETPIFSNLGIPMVRVKDIKRGNLSFENAKTVNEENYRKFIKKYKPKLGDIVMSRVGSYGISSYVDSDMPFCMGQNTVVINPLRIGGRFLYECLGSNYIQRQIELEVAGSGYKSLSLADIKALKIQVPPKHEQEQIGDLLLSIDGQVMSKKQKLSKTQSLKNSLMQDLLTGKVRVRLN